MIPALSSHFMRRSFQKTRYRFQDLPERTFRGLFGIYVHVPFCYTRCSFCPFYKELLSEEGKRDYLRCVQQEIEETKLDGQAAWVYFGGGTPNTLLPEDLAAIVRALRKQATPPSMGIELLPARATPEYLDALKALGFTKVSIGVESFSDEVIAPTGRRVGTLRHVERLVEHAHALGLWVNVDMMAGLPLQTPAAFESDIRTLLAIRPSQITTYRFLVIRGLRVSRRPNPGASYDLIERAAVAILESGYRRQGVWTFADGQDLYDSSRDELIQDYAGFGPAGFSTCGNWKMVNPELAPYLRGFREGRRRGFAAPKSPAADAWRRFARMLYDLKIDPSPDLPPAIRFYIEILRRLGYIRGTELTPKGVLFAHRLTQTVVESLPFPLQNPGCVENYQDYASAIG